MKDNSVMIYEMEPEKCRSPSTTWTLNQPGGKTLISDHVTNEDLPHVAKQDLPFIVKVRVRKKYSTPH